MHVVEIWLECFSAPFRLEFRNEAGACDLCERIKKSGHRTGAWLNATDHFGQTIDLDLDYRVVVRRYGPPSPGEPAVKKISNHLPKAKPVSKAKADEPMGGKMKKMTPMKGDKAGKGKPF